MALCISAMRSMSLCQDGSYVGCSWLQALLPYSLSCRLLGPFRPGMIVAVLAAG